MKTAVEIYKLLPKTNCGTCGTGIVLNTVRRRELNTVRRGELNTVRRREFVVGSW